MNNTQSTLSLSFLKADSVDDKPCSICLAEFCLFHLKRSSVHFLVNSILLWEMIFYHQVKLVIWKANFKN